MSKESSNQRSRATSLNSNPATNREPVFCKECLSNQRLSLALYSSFDPTLPSSTSFEEYKQSISERYPQVCGDCSEGVERAIEEANKKARANVLGEWMRRTIKTREKNGKSDQFERNEGGIRPQSYQVVAGEESGWKELIWRIRGLAWALTQASGLGAAVIGKYQTDHSDY